MDLNDLFATYTTTPGGGVGRVEKEKKEQKIVLEKHVCSFFPFSFPLLSSLNEPPRKSQKEGSTTINEQVPPSLSLSRSPLIFPSSQRKNLFL